MERSIAAALLDFQSSSYFSNTTANHSTNSADSKSRTSAISSAKTSSTQAKYCYRNNDRTSSKEGKVSAFTSSTASMGITKSVVKDLKFPIKVNSIRDKMTEFFYFLVAGESIVIAVIDYFLLLFLSTLLFLLPNKQRSLYLCWVLLVVSLFLFFCLLAVCFILFAHHNISFFNANVY